MIRHYYYTRNPHLFPNGSGKFNFGQADMHTGEKAAEEIQ